MAKTWWCPAHEGRISSYTLLDKTTGRGRWKLKIRCLTPTGVHPHHCNAVLNVMKGGVYLDRPAPATRAA